MRLEQIDKHKLIQFKNTKLKRLHHLESLAKQMELMQAVDLDKIISVLSQKDEQLKNSLRSNNENQKFMNELYKVREKEIKSIRDLATKETKLKEEAIAKMDELRSELHLL